MPDTRSEKTTLYEMLRTPYIKQENNAKNLLAGQQLSENPRKSQVSCKAVRAENAENLAAFRP